MNDNVNNVLIINSYDTYSDINYDTFSNINFNISLFIFIFVVYFLYTLLKDFFIRR